MSQNPLPCGVIRLADQFIKWFLVNVRYSPLSMQVYSCLYLLKHSFLGKYSKGPFYCVVWLWSRTVSELKVVLTVLASLSLSQGVKCVWWSLGRNGRRCHTHMADLSHTQRCCSALLSYGLFIFVQSVNYRRDMNITFLMFVFNVFIFGIIRDSESEG